MTQQSNSSFESMHHPEKANRFYKDSLFRFLFGNEEHKDWTLSLFNAVNGTHYTDPNEIQFMYSDDVFYIKCKEDVVFIVADTMQFFEHQSTWSLNLPIRFLLYGTKQISAYLNEKQLSVLSSNRIRLPKPKFFVFYNGEDKNVPRESILRLSSLYQDDSASDGQEKNYDLEVIVHILNINFGYNEIVQEACKPLEEYAWIVSEIRKQTVDGADLREVVRDVLGRIPEDFVVRSALMAEISEVIEMMFSEAENIEQIKNYGRQCHEEGKAEGLELGIEEKTRETIRRMLGKNFTDGMIIEIAGTTQEMIDEVRKEMKMK